MTRRKKTSRTAHPVARDNPFSEFMRRAAPRVVHNIAAAARTQGSVLEAFFSATKTEALAFIAEDAVKWVGEKRGRKAVLEWIGEGIALREYEPDGRERGEARRVDFDFMPEPAAAPETKETP